MHTHRVIYELTDAVKAVLEEAIEPDEALAQDPLLRRLQDDDLGPIEN